MNIYNTHNKSIVQACCHCPKSNETSMCLNPSATPWRAIAMHQGMKAVWFGFPVRFCRYSYALCKPAEQNAVKSNFTFLFLGTSTYRSWFRWLSKWHIGEGKPAKRMGDTIPLTGVGLLCARKRWFWRSEMLLPPFKSGPHLTQELLCSILPVWSSIISIQYCFSENHFLWIVRPGYFDIWTSRTSHNVSSIIVHFLPVVNLSHGIVDFHILTNCAF